MSRAVAAAVLLSLISSSLFSQQETFSNINTSLDELEKTIIDMQSETERVEKGTQSLTQLLTESETDKERLSKLSEELKRQSIERDQECKRLSDLLDISDRKWRNWRLASILEGAALATLVVSMILISK